MKFQKATKAGCFARVAMFGSSGSGKTYTALSVATGIAQAIGSRIALGDSEHGSASKYADRFDFDAVDLVKCDIDEYLELFRSAAEAKYGVLVIDSMTHAWHELLAEVDRFGARNRGNKFAGWATATPKQKALVDAILSYPGHVVATMRSKTEWVVENENGKNVPKRVGLAPEQGKGIEYEFDLLLELDPQHNAYVSKDRTGKYQDQTIQLPGEQFGRDLVAWLTEPGAPAVATAAPPVAPPAKASAAATAVREFVKVYGNDRARDEWGRVSTELFGQVIASKDMSDGQAYDMIAAVQAEAL